MTSRSLEGPHGTIWGRYDTLGDRPDKTEELGQDGLDPWTWHGTILLGTVGEEVGHARDDADVGGPTDGGQALGEQSHPGASDGLGAGHQRTIETV